LSSIPIVTALNYWPHQSSWGWDWKGCTRLFPLLYSKKIQCNGIIFSGIYPRKKIQCNEIIFSATLQRIFHKMPSLSHKPSKENSIQCHNFQTTFLKAIFQPTLKICAQSHCYNIRANQVVRLKEKSIQCHNFPPEPELGFTVIISPASVWYRKKLSIKLNAYHLQLCMHALAVQCIIHGSMHDAHIFSAIWMDTNHTSDLTRGLHLANLCHIN